MIESAKVQESGQKVRPKAEASQLAAALKLLEEVSACPPDPPTILALVAMRARQLTGAASAVIGMQEQRDMVWLAATGSASRLLGQRERLEGSLSAAVLATGEALLCVDTAEDPRVDPVNPDALGMRSLVVIPLRAPDGDVGVLMIGAPQPGAFGAEHLQILNGLGHLLMWRLDLVTQLKGYQVLITENEIALATLRESEDRFRSAFDHSGIGMALMASDGRWLKVNAALCQTLGYSRQELLARDHQSSTHPDDLSLEEPFMRKLMAGEINSYALEKRFVHKDRSVIWGLLTVSVVSSPGQQALYFIAQVQDITARKATEDALKRLAVRDDLTGLCNRREMLRLLKEECDRGNRHRRPMSLIILDIDAFKRVNDTHGHQAGDNCLRQIAQLVEQSVRSFDRVARYGGEEFVVILPETTAVDALAVAERIRTRVASEELTIGHQDGADVRITLTVSSGIATMSGESQMSAEEIIRRADASLYLAKNGGRNRCVAAP